MAPGRNTRSRPDPDIVIVGDGSPRTVSGKRNPTKTTKKTAPPVAHGRKENRCPTNDIIEISSDEEDEPVVRTAPSGAGSSAKDSAKMARMQDRLKQLERENVRLEQENKSMKQSVNDLDDGVSCEICSCKMWSPFILAECGHTFCQKDLQDWFQAALTRHQTAYPHYNVNQAPMHGYGYQLPQPAYTCPKCRASILSKPIQNFAVKHVVRVVAKQSRESSPKKITGNPDSANVWSRFFAR
ncbi:hypothetical protein C8F01DRAFT_1257014 [Mycena amicta]|nr:hypothetical protein C8F01DRAFT_1257014 [Mycena amicta]